MIRSGSKLQPWIVGHYLHAVPLDVWRLYTHPRLDHSTNDVVLDHEQRLAVVVPASQASVSRTRSLQGQRCIAFQTQQSCSAVTYTLISSVATLPIMCKMQRHAMYKPTGISINDHQFRCYLSILRDERSMFRTSTKMVSSTSLNLIGSAGRCYSFEKSIQERPPFSPVSLASFEHPPKLSAFCLSNTPVDLGMICSF